MKLHRLRKPLVAASAPAVLLLAGCTASGGGSIPSNDGVHKLTFGFSMDFETKMFSGTFKDPYGEIDGRSVDVSFKGTGRTRTCSHDTCKQDGSEDSKGGCLLAQDVPYVSRNKAEPGNGTFDIFACDVDGNGKVGGTDTIIVDVSAGPFKGYHNTGEVGGNITVKTA